MGEFPEMVRADTSADCSAVRIAWNDVFGVRSLQPSASGATARVNTVNRTRLPSELRPVKLRKFGLRSLSGVPLPVPAAEAPVTGSVTVPPAARQRPP